MAEGEPHERDGPPRSRRGLRGRHPCQRGGRAADAAPTAWVVVTRRALLEASSAALVLGMVGVPSAVARVDRRGQPFDDGTFFDDGFGWCD